MIRETIFTSLSADAELTTEGITDSSVYNIESVDTPPRNKPFLVLAYTDDPGVYGHPGRRDLLVWAHDESGDFSRIDRILERVRILLVGLIHQGGITLVEFTGGSPDLYDDGFRTITRNYGFRIIGQG